MKAASSHQQLGNLILVELGSLMRCEQQLTPCWCGLLSPLDRWLQEPATVQR